MAVGAAVGVGDGEAVMTAMVLRGATDTVARGSTEGDTPGPGVRGVREVVTALLPQPSQFTVALGSGEGEGVASSVGSAVAGTVSKGMDTLPEGERPSSDSSSGGT